MTDAYQTNGQIYLMRAVLVCSLELVNPEAKFQWGIL